jgi:hypothetical protein
VLRIHSACATSSRVTLKAEGALMGPWVPLLEAECLRHLEAQRLIELDFAGILFVDRGGIAMVRSLAGRGVRVVRASAVVNVLLGLGGPQQSE